MSFFGGDMSKAHWSVSIADNFNANDSREERQAKREAIKANRALLKAKGIKPSTYFQFTVTDKAGKAKQKVKADAEAARIEKATGVKIGVYEGCFL